MRWEVLIIFIPFLILYKIITSYFKGMEYCLENHGCCIKCVNKNGFYWLFNNNFEYGDRRKIK